MTTMNDPMELSSLGVLIADGQPHLHVVLTSKARGAFGGHLENGCQVLSHAEITILKVFGHTAGAETGGQRWRCPAAQVTDDLGCAKPVGTPQGVRRDIIWPILRKRW